MIDTLSQKDIDSLLKGAVLADPAAASATVIPYDFQRPPRISKERRATLEAIHGRLALNLQSLLSSRLRQPTDVSVSSVEQVTFAEFILSLVEPCAACVYDLGEQIGTQCVVDLGAELAILLVDRLFGGPGEPGDLRRPLTPLEQLVLRSVNDRLMALLTDAWGEHLRLQPSFAGFESSPEALGIANRGDNVLIVNIAIRSGKISGMATICIPLVGLESFLQEKSAPISARAGVATEASARRVEQQLRLARVDLDARFPLFQLKADDVARLRPGTVIHTGQALNTPIELRINGRCRFVGKLGQSNGFVGLHVTEAARRPDAAPRAPRGRVVQ